MGDGENNNCEGDCGEVENKDESVVGDVDGYGNKDEGSNKDEVGDGENNNGEGDCGEVENKDEEGDGESNNGEEILGEDFLLCLVCVW